MHNLKRIGAIVLASVMMVSPITTHAATLVNSTDSEFTSGVNGYDVTGEDITQGKVSSSKEIDGIGTTTHSEKSETEVYATKTSRFSVIVPKIITLDGESKIGSYQVSVKGDITGNQEIAITSPNTFVMKPQEASTDAKEDVVATIYSEEDGGAKTLWNQSEIKADTYDGSGTTLGVIEAKDITAGSWSGVFDFTIQCFDACAEESTLSLSTNSITIETSS